MSLHICLVGWLAAGRACPSDTILLVFLRVGLVGYTMATMLGLLGMVGMVGFRGCCARLSLWRKNSEKASRELIENIIVVPWKVVWEVIFENLVRF